MKTLTGRAMLAAMSLIAFTAPAFAHVTLETGQAAAGSTYKAVLRVPHGCSGADTISIKVQIPEGMISVKPMPKAGWKLETTTGAYAKTYELYGSKVSEGVQTITWSGGSLPDAWYDEFVFRGTLAGAEAGQTLYFPTIQTCSKGEEDWIAIPVEGQPEPDAPAPGLKIVAPAGK